VGLLLSRVAGQEVNQDGVEPAMLSSEREVAGRLAEALVKSDFHSVYLCKERIIFLCVACYKLHEHVNTKSSPSM